MKISELENNIKIKNRETKEKIKEIENDYQNNLTYMKIRKSLLIIIFIVISFTLSFLNVPLQVNLATCIMYFFTLKNNQKLKTKLNQLYLNKIKENKITMKKYEEIIDACELYKDFLNEKNLLPEDLFQILQYLSPYMGEELLPVYNKLNKQEKNSYNEETLSPSPLCYDLNFLLINVIINIHMNLFTIHQKEKLGTKEKLEVEKIEEHFQKLTESLDNQLDEKTLLVKIKVFYSLLDATNEILFEMNQSQTHHLQK